MIETNEDILSSSQTLEAYLSWTEEVQNKCK
jgi:hypothetical protein